MSWRLRFITLFFLLLFVLATISYHAGRKEELSTTETVALEVVASVQNAIIRSGRAVEDFWRGYFYLVNLHEENQSLRRTLDRLTGRLGELREAETANARLRSLLNFKDQADYPIVGARVVSWSPNAWFKTLTLDRGSSDGIINGMPVVTDVGVVGRIVGVAPHYSKVLLIIDYNSSVDAMVQRSRVRGVFSGRSERLCSLKYVLKNDDIVGGDLLVTSGMDGVFPKGLTLGTVSRARKIGHDIFQEVEVVPAVDFAHLEEVLVLLKEPPPL